MLPPSRYPRQRLLITLTLASGAPAALVNGLIAFIADDSWGRALVAAGALMLPPAYIAWRLLGEPSRRALGLVLAYAGLFTLAGGALYGGLFWYGMAFVAASLGGSWALALIGLAVIAPYVALGVAAERTIRELYGRSVARETGPQLLSVVLLYLGAFALGSHFDLGLSSGRRHAEWAMRDALRRSVFQVQACAIGHALAHPDSGYPRSLTAMGPSGQNCLDRRLANGRSKGLFIEYEPASPDAAGRVPSFIVHARAQRKRPASGEFLSAVGDTSGFIGETKGIASATHVGVPGEEMIDEVAHLRTCALLARAEHAAGAAASSIEEMATTLGRFDLNDPRAYLCNTASLRHLARVATHDSLGRWAGYRVAYTGMRDSSGRLGDFEIVARPIAYGGSGIRSYFVRSDGAIHITLANRAATTSDPAVPACEYGEKWNRQPHYTSTVGCAPMPSLRPPVVRLVHDSVATAGQLLTVAIRDRADPARPADPTHEHLLSCLMTPGPGLAPRSTGYNVFQLKSELDCVVDFDRRYRSLGDTVRIVVFTRDRSGAIGRAQSMVRLVAP